MWDIIKKFLGWSVEEEHFEMGALLDQRPLITQVQEDIMHDQIVAGVAPVQWVEKARDQWRVFPVRNQGRGSSCMANATAKIMGVLSYLRYKEFIKFSAAYIYKQRQNRPSEGMWLYDVLNIATRGVALEALVPSEQLTDPQIDAIQFVDIDKKVAEGFSADSPVYITEGDFETVASTIQRTGKAILGMFYFTGEEWGRLVPEVRDTWLKSGDTRAFRHAVAMVDVFLYNGRKVIRIEDSAHFGGLSERLITEDFFKKRNIMSGYLMRFKFAPSDEVSKPVFDGSIISAQKCLRYEGLFPTNIDFVETFGPVTREAVRKFQVKHGINPALGNLGPITIAKLKELYS
jgi:hypothetical protein